MMSNHLISEDPAVKPEISYHFICSNFDKTHPQSIRLLQLQEVYNVMSVMPYIITIENSWLQHKSQNHVLRVK